MISVIEDGDLQAVQPVKLHVPLAAWGRPPEEIHRCPVCRRTFPEFLDFSPTYTKVECPGCRAHPRQRMLMLYLKRLTRFFSLRLRVLHLSPHPGLRARFAAMRNLQYVTADLADRTVDVRVDITDLPFPDGAFDLIFCSHVLEHVEDDRRALSELFRVTHPNGVALIQVPIDRYRAATLEDPAIVTPQDREKYYWQFDHLRLYGPDFADRMRGAGFTVAVVESVEVAPAHQRRRFGIDRPEELLHVGHKASPAAVSAPPYGGRRRPILRRACAS